MTWLVSLSETRSYHERLVLSPISQYPTSRKTVLARSSNNGHEFSSNASLSVKPAKTVPGRPEADVVVIGSGIGGLCCAGLLARYNQDVLVLESHDLPGGTAHSFDIKDYKFDSGPSLFSGFESRGSQANPLAQLLVLDALGESIPCAKYDSWTVYIPEGEFLSRIGPTEFFKLCNEFYWRRRDTNIAMPDSINTGESDFSCYAIRPHLLLLHCLELETPIARNRSWNTGYLVRILHHQGSMFCMLIHQELNHLNCGMDLIVKVQNTKSLKLNDQRNLDMNPESSISYSKWKWTKWLNSRQAASFRIDVGAHFEVTSIFFCATFFVGCRRIYDDDNSILIERL